MNDDEIDVKDEDANPAPSTERLARRLAVALLVLAVAFVGAVVVGYQLYTGKVDCLNTTLGERQTFTSQDHDNEVHKIDDQTTSAKHQATGIGILLNPDKTVTDKQRLNGLILYAQGSQEFLKSLTDWKARNVAIDIERQKHPLGKC